jgi:FdhD protein
MTPITEGLRPTTYVQFEDNAFGQVRHQVPAEVRASICVNGYELVTLSCSPYRLDELAVGYLRSEGFIRAVDEIVTLHIAQEEQRVDIGLRESRFAPPARRISTSGLGGGVTFDDLRSTRKPIPTAETVETEQVCLLMQQLVQAADLYRQARGVHTAALSDGRQLLFVAQDIARHNTISRLLGQVLFQGVSAEGKILICTGRISSEMLANAAKMGAPLVISCSSPTSLSIVLAKEWNITLIGYATGDSFRIYSVPERVVLTRGLQQNGLALGAAA